MTRRALTILTALLLLAPAWAAAPQPLKVVRFEYLDSTVPRSQALSYLRGNLDVQNQGRVSLTHLKVRLQMVTPDGNEVWTRSDSVGTLKPGQHYRTDFLVYNPQFNTLRAVADCSYIVASRPKEVIRTVTQATVPAAGPSVPPGNSPPGYEKSSSSPTLKTWEETNKEKTPPGY